MIPQLNKVSLFLDTLHYIKAQTCKECKLIVVDDGATETTEEF